VLVKLLEVLLGGFFIVGGMAQMMFRGCSVEVFWLHCVWVVQQTASPKETHLLVHRKAPLPKTHFQR
jgi:hypothetical protein